MEMENSRVVLSVVVPVYNIVSYIDRCVESIVDQTYHNLEIILVDDGSTDGSGKKCDLWAQKDVRVQVIHKRNGGLVSARQAGVAVATGEYLAHVDGDDWIEREMYAEMLALAFSCDADIVTMGLTRDYGEHSVINREAFEPGIYQGAKLEMFWSQMVDDKSFFRSRVNPHITTKIFKKELIKDVQMRLSMDAKIGEDFAVVYPCLLAANCVVVSNLNYYHYTIRPGSIMDTSEDEKKSLKAVSYALNEAACKYEDQVPNIKKQFDQLLLYIRLFSIPKEIIKCNGNTIYPFKRFKKGDRILLYGAGRFGKALYNYIEESKVCEIVAWTDKSNMEGIVSVEKALECVYDKVVIAVLLADVAEEIRVELMSRGVDADKIVRLGFEESNKTI